MSNGLEGVIAAETGLSDVDGAAGRLVVRGRIRSSALSRNTRAFAEVVRNSAARWPF